jgi:lipid-A-disaccharide synthase
VGSLDKDMVLDNKSASLKIAIVAGESSGDLLGSHMIAALKSHLPNAEFYGIGGPKMQAQGFQALFPMEKLAVRGYSEVLKKYFEIVGIRKKLKAQLLQSPPDLFIGIDAPDFNLDLEIALKRKGIKTIHYVSPSIWAWRKERLHKIKLAVSHMLVLFPFEKKIYEDAGIPVTYIGHPLADILPMDPDSAGTKEQMKLPAKSKIVALLPGSRQSELEYMADTFIETAKLIYSKMPNVHFLVPLASRETRNQFEVALYKNEAEHLPLTILFGHAHMAMIAADAVLVASGTATLEAALLKKPMVITYKMAPMSWRITKKKKYQPYVGLPNILSEHFVVPEILQHDATPENLSIALSNLLLDSQVAQRLYRHFSNMHQVLKQNAQEKISQAILAEI